MDNNAQPLQQQAGQTQRQMEQPVQRSVPQAQASSSQNDGNAMNQVQAPQSTQDDSQQVSVSGHPEQGSIAVVENDDQEEEQQISPQEVKIQPSHQAEVVLPKEVTEAGVEQSDAKALALEAQLEETNVILGNDVIPASAPAVASGLPMSYEEVLQTQKTNSTAKNPDNAFAWFVKTLRRAWEKLQMSNLELKS